MDMDTGEGKRGKLKLSQLLQPMLMPTLTLIPGIATMDMVLDIMVTTADLTMVVTTGHTDMDTGVGKRGKLSQLLQLMLMPKLTLIPGIATMDMVLVTMVTTADPTMVATTGHTDTDTGDERRGRLMLNLKLTQKLKLIPGTVPMDMV